MPQFVLKRRDFLGITMTGAAVLFWKPSKAKALGGKLPEIGDKAPGFDLPGTLGGGRVKKLETRQLGRSLAGALFLSERFHVWLHD